MDNYLARKVSAMAHKENILWARYWEANSFPKNKKLPISKLNIKIERYCLLEKQKKKKIKKELHLRERYCDKRFMKREKQCTNVNYYFGVQNLKRM